MGQHRLENLDLMGLPWLGRRGLWVGLGRLGPVSGGEVDELDLPGGRGGEVGLAILVGGPEELLGNLNTSVLLLL